MSEETKKTDAAVEETAEQKEQDAPATEEQKGEASPAEEQSAEATEESADDAGEDVEVPEKFVKLVEEVENMSVLELNELVKVLEKKFGVSAAAVAVAGAGAGGDADAAEEKSEFNVELTNAGDQKIQVIKAVKEVLGLGLKEAKDLVEAAPTTLKEGVPTEDAEALKEKIEAAGGSVELK